ncbi:hypothetical protein NPIL_17161, partial [Nephila pilipes]
MSKTPSYKTSLHSITWEIKDFLQYPHSFMGDLQTPEMIIECIDLTIWKLSIHMSKDTMISCVIKRMDHSKIIPEVIVKYYVYVEGGNE